MFLIELSEYASFLGDMKVHPIVNIRGKTKHYKDDIVLANLFLVNKPIRGSPLATFIPDSEDRPLEAQQVDLRNTWETADRNEFQVRTRSSE